MPVSLAQIADNTATASFAWGADTVNLVYFPGHVTEQIIAQFQGIKMDTLGNVVDGFETLNEILCGVPAVGEQPEQPGLLKSWDAYEDTAMTILIPITTARFARLPIPFRMQVFYAIMGDVRPN
jgi:hypothetical protein